MPYALLTVSLIIFICIAANRLSRKIGIPTLMLFIVSGILFGAEGIVKIRFDNNGLAGQICSLALLFIIFYGGFCTRWEAAKPVAAKSMLLSSFGTVATALLTGVFCRFILGMGFLEGLLLGSVLSSTDAASVFFILRSKKLDLKYGTASMLEMESGSNDPFAYMMTVIVLSAMKGAGGAWPVLKLLLLQIVVGASAGCATGWLAAKLLKHKISWGDGFDTIFVFGTALLSYALPAVFAGNGYLAVYISGIILGNQELYNQKKLVAFFDAYTGLMQMVLFFLLGLMALPSKMGPTIFPAFLVALFLTFIARPAAAALILAPFKVKPGQYIVVSWAGLRGAASIVFAILAADGEGVLNYDLFHTVFCVVLFSILIQGSLLPAVSRACKMIDKDSDVMRTFSDYTQSRQVRFIQFKIDRSHPWLNRAIENIELFPHTRIAVVVRGNETVVPRGQTVLLEGDTAILCAEGAPDIPDIFLKEIPITADHRWCGKSISQARISKTTIIVMIKREGNVLIPNGGTVFRENDLAVAYSRPFGLKNRARH